MSKRTRVPTATCIRSVGSDQSLYKLTGAGKPRYVVVSATHTLHSGNETLVFDADKHGDIRSMREVGGVQGSRSHRSALRDIGFSKVVACPGVPLSARRKRRR